MARLGPRSLWFGGDPDQITLLELGTQLSNPIPMAVGMSPDVACRTAVRAHVGHPLPGVAVHVKLDAAVSAAAELILTAPGGPSSCPATTRPPAR